VYTRRWTKEQQQAQPEQQAAAKQQPPAEVGKPLGAPKRNPMDLIKVRSAATPVF